MGSIMNGRRREGGTRRCIRKRREKKRERGMEQGKKEYIREGRIHEKSNLQVDERGRIERMKEGVQNNRKEKG